MRPFSQFQRTHTCGELTKAHAGQTVRLNGWVKKYRNHGGILFIDLRDRFGITQVVFHPQNFTEEQMNEAGHFRGEFVIAVVGTVMLRPEGMINPNLATGAIEVDVRDFEVLAESETPPFEIEEETTANEDLRLTYRYLDLRRRFLADKIELRHRLAFAVRQYMHEQKFLEIETPLMMRSTPEGARDYVVPSRVHPGKFYALPQSPQLFKQILMIAGFDRYFQLARCLRDEDLRADRQPEHTQIDIEMSFVTQDDIFTVVEGMMKHAFREVMNVDIAAPFPRFPYDQIMSEYGSDKPDCRYEMKLVDFGPAFGGTEFKVFADALATGGVVKGMVVKGQAGLSRKQLEEIEAEAKLAGAKGLAWIALAEEVKSPIKKFLTDQTVAKLKELGQAQNGDLILLAAGVKLPTELILGRVRSYCGKKFGLIDKSKYVFLWVTDFPLFEYNKEINRFDAMHNIVTSPKEPDIPLLDEGFTSSLALADPNHPWARIRANQYDLVCNGFELASGGIRNYRSDMQKKVLNILGMDDARAERMFGFLLNALKYGAPPHGGIALGLDRVTAIMTDSDSLRDVIAFPKTTAAQSLMDGAPTEIEPEQLAELHLSIAIDKKK